MNIIPIKYDSKEEAFEEAKAERGSLVIETEKHYYFIHAGYDMDQVATMFCELINYGIIRKAYYHYFA